MFLKRSGRDLIYLNSSLPNFTKVNENQVNSKNTLFKFLQINLKIC